MASWNVQFEPAVLRSREKVSIDGIPLSKIEGKQSMIAVMGAIEVTNQIDFTVFKNWMILFNIGNTEPANLARNRMLYKTIAGSMVFLDKWK